MAIVVYLLYRFIVNFLMPVIRATRQVREQFRNMQDQANGGGGTPGHGASSGGASNGGASHGGFQSANGDKHTSAKPPADDYIDFEEVK